MKVQLLNYTGFGHPDSLFAAKLLVYAKQTRLQGASNYDRVFKEMTVEELMDELIYISNTIRSSWEFVDYTFQLSEVTIAFSRQFNRGRQLSIAERTTRVEHLNEIIVEEPETIRKNPVAHVKWLDFAQAMKYYYAQFVSLDIPAQDARAVLPLNTHTSECVKLNLRTMADICAKRINIRAQGEHTDVVDEMKQLVLGVHPWAKEFLEPERLATPLLDALMKKLLGDKGYDADVASIAKEIDKLKAVWG